MNENEIVTGKKIKYEETYVCAMSGDIEINFFIDALTKAKNEILEKYPEAANNRIQVTVEHDEEYCEFELNIGYIRYETDAEYRCRMKAEENKKLAAISEMKRRIDANREEAVNYLKSIGAI
jgi:hypothetical protein